MNRDVNLLLTGRSTGYTNKIARYGSKAAEHEQYGRTEFLNTLHDFHQNLGIEGRADSPERIYDENGELIEQIDTKIEWESLACPKCNRNVLHTKKLLEHILESHAKQEDKKLFQQCELIGKDLRRLLEEAVETQASCSYVKRKFENSNDMLVCPVDSPLFPFIAMRHVQVYFREVPAGVTEGINLQMLSAGCSYTVIFVLSKAIATCKKIRRNFEIKAQNKKLRELEKLCIRAWVPEHDIVFKKKRTAEETRALGEALELEMPYTQKEILNKVNEIKTRREEMNSVYNNTVKSDGQIMTSEEKKLISSLSSNYMVPIAGKRKTTYKNPSELIPTKRKKKSSSAPATPPSS